MHTRKKGGERKDKKVARMREAVEERHAHQEDPKPQSDQWDIQAQKPGSARDHMNPQERGKLNHPKG